MELNDPSSLWQILFAFVGSEDAEEIIVMAMTVIPLKLGKILISVLLPISALFPKFCTES